MEALANELRTARHRLTALESQVKPDSIHPDCRPDVAVRLFAQSFDAVWKIGKNFLGRHLNISAATMGDAIRELFVNGYFTEEQNRAALHMLEARKQLFQNRKSEVVDQVYLQLPMYRIQLEHWLDCIESQLFEHGPQNPRNECPKQA